MDYRNLELSDYENAVALWQRAEDIRLRDADSKEGIKKYLLRNPGLSFIAESEGDLLGTIMAGHDGKRGYIQHLAVDEPYRKMGVATQLLKLCLNALFQEGIRKSHVHVLSHNELAKAFWQSRGWVGRTDIQVYSYINGGGEDT